MSAKHQKHSPLIRPFDGMYGRNEWGILGTNCTEIRRFAEKISQHFSAQFTFNYLDADHAEKSNQEYFFAEESTIYQDFFEHKMFFPKNSFDIKNFHQQTDIVLLNGNHFESQRQIIIVDSAKEASLKRKLNRLTGIDFVLLRNLSEPFDFLYPYMTENTKILPYENADDILFQGLASQFEKLKPALYGLVLAGGKSQRMGRDKSLLNYHGKAQKDYIFDILSQYCDKSFFSVQNSDYQENTIKDTFLNLGVLGGILSAFRFNPRVAWLAVAVDMPDVHEAVISELVRCRNPKKMATAFHNPETNFPDPLVTIYEPKAYQRLLAFLGMGYSCPRKTLIHSECEIILPKNPDILLNINTLEEFEAYQKKS